jgi:DNA end-binding protein Ku
MRAIWKGAISFGLVTIPIGVYSATEDRRPKFRQLRESDHSPIRYRRVAENDGEEVQNSEIVKGYEFEKGRYVVFTDDELAAAAAGGPAKMVDVVQFVDQSEIDPIYYQKSYYLAPESTGVKAYEILRRALQDKNRVGIAKVAMRGKEHLATLRADGDVLILETMFWPDEIRPAEFEDLVTPVEVRDEEIKMAEMIIDNLTSEFDPESWVDTSRVTIEELAQAKIDGQEIVQPEAPEPTKVVDLLEALKASVEATKAQKKKAG